MDFRDAIAGDSATEFVVTNPHLLAMALSQIVDERMISYDMLSRAIEWWRLTGEVLPGVETKEKKT